MSNVSNEFKDAIKQWVTLDNKRAELNQQSNKIKKDMNNIESFILTFMDANDMKDKNILINDGKLHYDTANSWESITKKYILEKATLYFKNEKKAEEFVRFLYDSRSCTEKTSLKRKANSKKKTKK